MLDPMLREPQGLIRRIIQNLNLQQMPGIIHLANRANQALDDVDFTSLRRRVPVRLVVPRALRRLARASHAFGPLTPALFHVLGAGWRESCFDEVGDATNPVQSGEEFLRAFEAALKDLGKPAEIHVYDGAKHAFANPSGGNYKADAAADAWQKSLAFLAQHLKGG